jgi:hypothetical protein
MKHNYGKGKKTRAKMEIMFAIRHVTGLVVRFSVVVFPIYHAKKHDIPR